MPPSERLDIFAVIVLYNKTIHSSTTFRSLYSSAKKYNFHLSILLYDNSKVSCLEKNSFSDNYITVEYVHDPRNLGVSTAYNVAARIAQNKNVSWILLLDQDTDFPSTTLFEYKRAMESLPSKNLIVPILESPKGIFSPLKLYFLKGVILKSVKPGFHNTKNKSILNSGILIRTETYISIGGYNEKIKLYFSDFDFFRKYSRTYRSFYVLDVICSHDLSDISNIQVASALNRFANYCEGAFFFSENRYDYTLLCFNIGLRMLKLSLTYRTTKFFSIYYKVFFGNKVDIFIGR